MRKIWIHKDFLCKYIDFLKDLWYIVSVKVNTIIVIYVYIQKFESEDINIYD